MSANGPLAAIFKNPVVGEPPMSQLLSLAVAYPKPNSLSRKAQRNTEPSAMRRSAQTFFPCIFLESEIKSEGHIETKGEEEQTNPETHEPAMLLAPHLEPIGRGAEIGDADNEEERNDEYEIIQEEQRYGGGEFSSGEQSQNGQIRGASARKFDQHHQNPEQGGHQKQHCRVAALHALDFIRVKFDPSRPPGKHLQGRTFAVPEIILDLQKPGEDCDNHRDPVKRKGQAGIERELQDPESQKQVCRVNHGRVEEPAEQHAARAFENFEHERDQKDEHPENARIDAVRGGGTDDDTECQIVTKHSFEN